MNEHEELEIYRNLLLRLHTSRCSGDRRHFEELINKISDYAHARTISSGDYEKDQESCNNTLLELDK